MGKALKNRRDQAQILTKVGLRWDNEEGAHFFDVDPEEGGQKIFRNLRPKSIRAEVEASLKRLNTDYIDLLQCHWPDPSFPVEESMEELATLRKEGKIREIGVSNFDTDLLQRSQETLHPIPLASTQPRYSLLDRKIEKDIFPWLEKNNVGCIVYSPIEQGLLAGAVPAERSFPDNDGRSYHPMFSKENRIIILDALKGIDDICLRHNCTYAQLSIAWCIHRSAVTAAIVGARNPKQAIENAEAMKISLSADEVNRLTKHFQSLPCCSM